LTAWKKLELRTCRALGGQRSGPLGTHTSDCIGVPWAVEIKRCTKPTLRADWITQARSHGKNEGKPWLLIQATHGSRMPLVTLEFGEFVRLGRMAGLIHDQTEV
jgi:hypothetical protein